MSLYSPWHAGLEIVMLLYVHAGTYRALVPQAVKVSMRGWTGCLRTLLLDRKYHL